MMYIENQQMNQEHITGPGIHMACKFMTLSTDFHLQHGALCSLSETAKLLVLIHQRTTKQVLFSQVRESIFMKLTNIKSTHHGHNEQ